MKIKKIQIFVAVIVIFLSAVIFSLPKLKAAGGFFANGDIVDGKNVTAGDASYHDPITASDTQRIRLRLRVVNQGTDPINNTIVSFNLGNPLSPTGTVSGDGVTSQTDFLNINPSGSSLQFVSGTGKIFGPACSNGCAAADSIVTSGVNIGTVTPGETNSFQISIEADVVGTPSTPKAVFRSGNIFDGGTVNDIWTDPINATPGQIVEFRTTVINDGTATANNVIVRVQLPTTQSTTLQPVSFVTGGSADQVSDIATVNVSGTVPQELVYLPGHAIKFGPGCNTNSGCPLADTITGQGVSIGDVAPGVTNSYQVVFKTVLSNQVSPTPTVTPSPTPTPTQTPGPNPTSSCSNLTASTTSGTRPLTITFTGSGSDSAGSIQQYQFNFGDNSNGQDQIVTTNSNQASHVYNNAGNFNASLLVKDSRGNWVGGGSCQLNLNVNNPPTVLGTSAPTVLPKTGGNDQALVAIASIPTILGGIYLYRRFKLL